MKNEEKWAIINAATPGRWWVDGNKIIQTNHITRDIWSIPQKPEDLHFISIARTEWPKDLMRLEMLEKAAKDLVVNIARLAPLISAYDQNLLQLAELLMEDKHNYGAR